MNNISNYSIDYEFKYSYNGLHSNFTDSSNTYKLLKWSTFSNSWNNFTEKYKTFHFDKSLNNFSVRLANDTNSIANLETPINTKKICKIWGQETVVVYIIDLVQNL